MEYLRKFYEKDLATATPLTQEELDNLNIKTYFNGEEIKVGEVILVALLVHEPIEKENGDSQIVMEGVLINERHFDLFEISQFNHGNTDKCFISLKK